MANKRSIAAVLFSEYKMRVILTNCLLRLRVAPHLYASETRNCSSLVKVCEALLNL